MYEMDYQSTKYKRMAGKLRRKEKSLNRYLMSESQQTYVCVVYGKGNRVVRFR